jgi:hypothetical protein
MRTLAPKKVEASSLFGMLEKAMEGRRLYVKDNSDGEDSDASGFSDSDFGSDDD